MTAGVFCYFLSRLGMVVLLFGENKYPCDVVGVFLVRDYDGFGVVLLFFVFISGIHVVVSIVLV